MVGITVDKMNDHTAVNGVSYFSPTTFSLCSAKQCTSTCEMSKMTSQIHKVIALAFDLILNVNEAEASLFIAYSYKMATTLGLSYEKFLTKGKSLQMPKSGRELQ